MLRIGAEAKKCKAIAVFREPFVCELAFLVGKTKRVGDFAEKPASSKVSRTSTFTDRDSALAADIPQYAAIPDDVVTTESELVERAKTNPEALAELYRQHNGPIYAYVLRRIGNEHDANDVVAEVFLTMVRYLPCYECRSAPFRSWLLRLATTQINRWVRRRRRTNLWQSLITSIVGPENRPGNDLTDRQTVIRECLLSLPIRFQAVLSLHYFEDQSIESIAQILECRPGTVKSRLSRGRELLRRALSTHSGALS